MALSAPTQKLPLASYGKNRRARTKHCTTLRMAASSDVPTYEEGQLERPKWAGGTPLSRLVGALISFKPISSVLKFGARQVLISTAEKNDIPWRKMTKDILESDVYKEMESIQNPFIVYPDCLIIKRPRIINKAQYSQPSQLEMFWTEEQNLITIDYASKKSKYNFFDNFNYLNPFHAYEEGNLSWLAAAEAEAADLSMTRRAVPYASSVDEANEVVLGNWLQAIEQHHQQYSREIRDILDIGCSVGVSSRFLADKFPSAKVTGLDLSPYFLAVAQLKENRRVPRKNPIRWIHAIGEDSGLPSNSFDVVSLRYVLHECPEGAIIALLKEAFRLLRPGGTIALNDIAPKSKILQELSPVLFTLMKSTEPFLDEYCLTDLERRMREAGFVNVTSVLTDPRHRTVTGTVPS